jgi:histidinol-phosphate/aromatic aminotransferase/cobyric acid decarboxylase-like protein
VDEAFIDPTPQQSLCSHCERAGLIVLRSLGKFFGLAGARVGFVCARSEVLTRLQAVLGPWSVSGPSRWVATAALLDRHWQAKTRRTLQGQGERLRLLLASHGLAPEGGTALFQWLRTPGAAELHRALARRGILTRLFDTPASLRFGLPGNEAGWARLDAALSDVSSLVAVS